MGSAWYVYAIVGADTPLPPAAGIAVALTRVSWRKLAAVAAPTVADRPSLTTETALRHEAVVEAVRQQGPALPVRFGTVLRDADAVQRALAERYDVLVADLDRVGDKVELSLTVLWPAAAWNDVAPNEERAASLPMEARTGAGYLRARAADIDRGNALRASARALANELDDALGGLALERRVTLVPKAVVAIRATYLLEPTAVSAFRARFDAMRQARGDVQLLLTGPWPPYSFVRQREPPGCTTLSDGLAEIAQRFTDRMWGRAG